MHFNCDIISSYLMHLRFDLLERGIGEWGKFFREFWENKRTERLERIWTSLTQPPPPASLRGERKFKMSTNAYPHLICYS